MEKFFANKITQAISELIPGVVRVLKSEGIDVSDDILISAFNRVSADELNDTTVDTAENQGTSSPKLEDYPLVLSTTKKRGRTATKSATKTTAKSTTKSATKTTAKSEATPCQAMTKGGNQCKRNAAAGKKYCTMHERVYGNSSASTSNIEVVPKKSFMTAPPQKSKPGAPMPSVEPIAIPEMDDDSSDELPLTNGPPTDGSSSDDSDGELD